VDFRAFTVLVDSVWILILPTDYRSVVEQGRLCVERALAGSNLDIDLQTVAA
jgi:hypothetical protein